MNEYTERFRKYIQYSLFFTAVIVLGWAITPYSTVFSGLLLGQAVGFYNLVNMYWKIKRFGLAISEGRSVKSLGNLTRMLTAGLAVLIAIRYPEVFHLVSVVVGLMSVYAIIFIDSLIQVYAFGKKRGEN
jgi:ATP synthase protein I